MVTGLGLVYIECCNSYRGRLRSTNVLWWLQGLADDPFLLLWLQRQTDDHQGDLTLHG